MSNQGSISTHTPIEVDHSRSQRFKLKNKFNRVNSTVNSATQRQIQCWHCSMLGHISRDLKKKQKKTAK